MPLGPFPFIERFNKRIAAVRFAVTMLIGGGFVLAQQLTTVETEVRINARQLDDGRTEFALQQRDGDGWGERQLVQRRYLDADLGHSRWLSSSPFAVSIEVPAANTAMTETAPRLVFPSNSLVTQGLVDAAFANNAGISNATVGEWAIIVDASDVLEGYSSLGIDVYACRGDGNLWWLSIWESGDTPVRWWPTNTTHDAATDSLVAAACGGILTGEDRSGTWVPVTWEDPSAARQPSTSSASAITVSGRGENSATFRVSAGTYLATMSSSERCSMWIENASGDLNSIGELGSSRTARTTYTAVWTFGWGTYDDTPGLWWTDPISCDGSWTITLTPID